MQILQSWTIFVKIAKVCDYRGVHAQTNWDSGTALRRRDIAGRAGGEETRCGLRQRDRYAGDERSISTRCSAHVSETQDIILKTKGIRL